MMRRIKNGEPVFHVHNCSPEREGKVMTAEELHAFAVDVLMLEYTENNCDVIKYNKSASNEADFCFVNTGKIPNFTADNLAGKKVNVLLVYKENINDIALEDLDTTWMVEEYHKNGAIPRVTFFSTWCISENSVNGSPAICGGEFCFQYYSVSLIPGEENEPMKQELSDIELASKYVQAWQEYDETIIAPYLDKDFHYSSISVFDEMPSRFEYLNYFKGKLSAVKRGGNSIVFFVGRDHQTGDVAVLLVFKSGNCDMLEIKTKDGRIMSACMKEHDKRFKFFDPANEIFQGHGNHIDCIMPAGEFINNRLRSILDKSKWLYKKLTEVTTEDMYEEATEVNSLVYGDSDIKVLSLVALDKENEKNMFMSTYPITKGNSYDVVVDKVIEWDNQIEATVYCSIGEFEFAFFAADYYCNKDLYVVGNEIAVDLSALGLNVEEGQRGFQFEGQRAIDWLAKIGKEPTYDKYGNVEPIKFSMENLVAFFNKNPKWPDEAEFQSPVEDLNLLSILDIDFFKTNVKICRRETEDGELVVSIPLYFRKEFFPTVQNGDPIRGWLWISGTVTDEHELEINGVRKTLLGKMCAYVERYLSECNFGSFLNLMHILPKLPLLKIKEGYELDAFQRGDDYGYVLKTYCCKAGAVDGYKPTIEQEMEETCEEKSFFGLLSKTKVQLVQKEIHVPYDDSLRIYDRINSADAVDIPSTLTYFDVPFTEYGIMQAWILDNLTDFMPKGWHCNYSNKFFIFDFKGAKAALLNKFANKPEMLEKIESVDFKDLLPVVTINGDSAILEYAYWSNWQGLVKAKTIVEKSGCSVKFSKPETKVIVKYDCGIVF